MKHAITYFLILFVYYSSFSQVGIGNTDPKAQLDISAGTTPSAKDGILVPRLDEFPTGVDANQDGLLVFITGGGTPTKGFYFWDNDETSWTTIGDSNVKEIDDLSDGRYINSSIFLGYSSGINDDGTLNRNVGLGAQALMLNTSGSGNVAVGYRALKKNIDGFYNTAIGNYTLEENIDGFNNIAIGNGSLQNNQSGVQNISLGIQSLHNNVSGIGNTAFGNFALLNNEAGENNIAFGAQSLLSNISGSNNLAFGSNAGKSALGDKNVFIGHSSGFYEAGSNKLYIENSNADEDNALIYGEFDNNILRTNGEFQIGNPTGSGYALPTTDGTSGQVLSTDGSGQLNFETIADWYKEGTTTASNNITDNIYTEGDVTIDGETYISNKLGIGSGAEDPDGYLEIRANNSVAQPNIKLVDIGSSGARISFTNTITTNGNTWTLFGDTSNTTSSNLFHLYHTNAGNILTAKGDGDIGIKGTPNTDFHIYHGNSGTSDGLKLQNSTDNTWWRFYVSSGSDDLRLYNSNNGSTMMGAFNDATGAYSSTSDRRLKKDFKALHFSWSRFMQLNPLTYKYKKDQNPTNYVGMVAQDVETIYPELVTYTKEEDIYHMDYSATGVVAIKAVQELKSEVNILEEKIKKMANENLKLQTQLSKYENLERRLSALEKTNNSNTVEITEASKE